MAEKLDGMIVKEPRQGAPDFVLGQISFNVEKVIADLKARENNGWVNLDLKKSKEGKIYAEINAWKPSNDGPPR